MKNKKKFIHLFIILLLSSVLVSLVLPKFKSEAGPFGAMYFYMSRIKAGLDGATGNEVEIILAFETTQTFVEGGEINIYFPDAGDTQWCRTAGDITVLGVTSSAVDLATTSWTIDAALPTETLETLSASCTQGTGAISFDTLTIQFVGALTANTTYGVKLSNGTTGRIGTANAAGQWAISVQLTEDTQSKIDFGTFKLSIIAEDTVVVSAEVAEIPTVTCNLTGSTANIGVLYPGGAFSFSGGTNNISAYTNTEGSGYYWAIYGEGDGSTDAGLYYGSGPGSPYLLPSTGSTTVDLRPPGVKGFGLTATPPTEGENLTANFNSTVLAFGVYGAINRTPAGARILIYTNTPQTNNSTSYITYGAKADATAPAGTYTEYVTFVCGGYY